MHHHPHTGTPGPILWPWPHLMHTHPYPTYLRTPWWDWGPSQAIWVVVVGVRGSSSTTKYLCIFDERHCCLVRVTNAAVLGVFPYKVA